MDGKHVSWDISVSLSGVAVWSPALSDEWAYINSQRGEGTNYSPGTECLTCADGDIDGKLEHVALGGCLSYWLKILLGNVLSCQFKLAHHLNLGVFGIRAQKKEKSTKWPKCFPAAMVINSQINI